MTNYYTIDNSNVNDLAALSNQLLLALGIAPGNIDHCRDLGRHSRRFR